MLEVKHLSYTVTENQETLPIVTDISFTVNDGEMLVITGPNGGGKSTIAKLLMGVIRETEGNRRKSQRRNRLCLSAAPRF